MSARSAVFRSYRRLYRARAALFRGDVRAMVESRTLAREQFQQHGVEPITDLQHFQGLLSMVEEAVDMLQHGIVRGDRNPKSGHFGTDCRVVVLCFGSDFARAGFSYHSTAISPQR